MRYFFTFFSFFITVFTVVDGQSIVRDSSFGLNGIALTGLKDVFANNYGNNFAVGTDGNIICVGGEWVTTSSASFIDQRAYRLNSDGSNDPTFYLSTGYINPIAPAIQDDSKILLAWDSKISRFFPNGQLDSTFGINGVTSFNWSFYWTINILIQQDGKIIVYGTTSTPPDQIQYFTAFRLLKNGTFDTTFGQNGGVRYAFDSEFSLHVPWVMREFSDGRLLMGGFIYGNVNRHVGLLKLNTNGIPDSTFGVNGFVHNGFKKYAECYGMDVTSDDKIVLAGYSVLSFNENDQAMVARFNANGTLDSTFFTVGVRYFSNTYENTGLAVTSDNKIVFCGVKHLPNTVMYVGGLLENGENDPAFGDSSLILFNEMSAVARSIQVVNDSTYMVSGYSPPGNGDNNIMLRLLKVPTATTSLWNTANNLPAVIYPNPVTDVLHLRFQLPLSSSVTITLLDLKGELIHTWFAGRDFDAGENNLSLDFPKMVVSGTYVLNISNGEKSAALELVKVR